MDSDLRSSRSLGSIGIVDEGQGLSQLSHFHPDSQPVASFRSIGDVDQRQPLQNATQAQNAVALESNAQATADDGIPLLQSHPSFQQPSYGGLTPDPMATSLAGQLPGKLILDPPDLEYWRDKLFHVDETITLSEDQYAISYCNGLPELR